MKRKSRQINVDFLYVPTFCTSLKGYLPTKYIIAKTKEKANKLMSAFTFLPTKMFLNHDLHYNTKKELNKTLGSHRISQIG